MALLTAFYVDNGPHLPVWDRLPVVVLWVAPTLIGAAVIARCRRRLRGIVQTPGTEVRRWA